MSPGGPGSRSVGIRENSVPFATLVTTVAVRPHRAATLSCMTG
jgi:hypothetical protein